MNRISCVLLVLLFAVLVMPTASASEYYLVPDNNGVTGYGDCTNVGIWLDATDGVYSGFINLTYDPSCAKITDFTYNNTCFNMLSGVSNNYWIGQLTIGYECVNEWQDPLNSSCTPGLAHICNFTICCNTTSPSCQTDIVFDKGTGIWPNIPMAPALPLTTDNGTFTCGTTPSEETFSKPLYEGWNLISLPLDPAEDNSASAVLSTISYDAVYRYNATSKHFEGIESTDAMNPKTGYFVHATGDCTWTYNGTANNTMDISLKQGLNMAGWLNCSRGVGDALSSISGDYNYVARWNATAEKFEVYNTVAPSAFNDFTTMDRGTGYFISAKQECALSENC